MTNTANNAIGKNTSATSGGITMKKVDIIDQVATKVAEMEELLDELLNNKELSDNTKRTQKFQRQTAIHTLKVLMAIANANSEDVKFTMDQEKWYKSMVTLTQERKAQTTLDIVLGDNIMQVMQKNPKATMDKIEKALQKKGWKLDNMVVVKQ